MSGSRLKELREARRLTQQQLGNIVGRSKSVISRIEAGETGLDLDLARKIAKALKCSLAELVGADLTPPSVPIEDELVRYEPVGNDPLKRMVGQNRYAMEVRSDALASHGILRGDSALVDGSHDT